MPFGGDGIKDPLHLPVAPIRNTRPNYEPPSGWDAFERKCWLGLRLSDPAHAFAFVRPEVEPATICRRRQIPIIERRDERCRQGKACGLPLRCAWTSGGFAFFGGRRLKAVQEGDSALRMGRGRENRPPVLGEHLEP